MKRIIYLIFLISIFSCTKNRVVKPIDIKHDDFLKASSEREKIRQKKEWIELESWVQKNTEYNFKKNNLGFFIDYKKQTGNKKPLDLDYVQYKMQYLNLKKDTIYTYDEIGINNKIMSKTEMIRGVDSALRLMGEGDKAIVLLPSFMAYGLYGDDEEIGANMPLLIEIELLKIKKVTK